MGGDAVKLRSKLTLTLLLTGLVSAAVVGGTAYWLLMRGFQQSIQDSAFENFQADVTAYMRVYGTRIETAPPTQFHDFVQQRRRSIQRPPPPEGGAPLIDRTGQPPFRFLLLDPAGRVIKEGGDYKVGQEVPESLVRLARPIRLEGEVVALAVPLGDPNLSEQDRSYLAAMRRALLIGFIVAGSLALLLGVLFGRRMSATLSELTTAIYAMRAKRGVQHQVPVRSRDEIGVLATAFNEMSAELAEAHSELKELSIRDPLTQLYNRRHFVEQAAKQYEQALRYGHPLSVMIGDLDRFKQINDSFSHAVGDEVLRRIGMLLCEHTRKSDIVARYGGEEFVVVFTETPMEQAVANCEELRGRIEAEPWGEVREGLQVTMSIGVSGNLEGMSGIEDVLHEADLRLYAAKRAGRNRVEAG